MHASHHSAYTGSPDANFSTVFSVWDRLFGTYITPTPEHLAVRALPYGRDQDLDLRYLLTLTFEPETVADAASRSEPWKV